MPLRILIADDNPQVRAAMREVLEAEGKWEIIEAENGDEAIAKAQECLPRLIVLDLAMPVKDGLAASREIAKLLPGTPIVMHTLYSSAQIQIEAAKSGIRKVVPKSESAALVKAVREALEPGASDEQNTVTPNVVPALDPAQSEGDRHRAEDRIRELCVQVITTANDDPALQARLAELREALHRHVEQFRARLVEYPAIAERRARNGVSQSDAGLELRKLDDASGTAKAQPIAGTADEKSQSGDKSEAMNGV